jgi:S1-C subfamily serine protease
MINKALFAVFKMAVRVSQTRIAPGLQRHSMNIAGVDNQKNSSGFLFSMEGTVIGIVSHIMETSGF